MRTEEEVRERIISKKAAQKHALENKLMWSMPDIGHEIKELEWVLEE